MRYNDGLLALSTILLCLLSTAPSLILAVPSVANQRPAAPFQIPLVSQQASTGGRPWVRVRDHIIRFIWRIPERQQDRRCSGKADISRSPSGPKQSARYGDDVVLRFKIGSAEEASALAEASNVLFLDIWEFTKDWVDVRLAKEVVPSLLGLLPSSLRHAHTPLMHDLAQTIYESYPSSTTADTSTQTMEDHRAFSPSLRTSADTESNIFFRNYQPLSVIVPWMRLLQSLFPSHVRMINIGITYEGRDIPALRIGVHPTNSEKPSAPRKSVIIAGGSHAREWISTSTVNYVAYSLITSYGKSRSMTKLLEDFDWIFIPTLNPDGYIYTWEHDRLWRKNRQRTSLRFCKGIDLDKAYDFKWDGEATAGNPCSESFAGDEPLQGVESRRLADWARNETENNNVEFVGFLDLHSYSQNVLYPYAYSCDSTPRSLENLEELATGLAKAMRLSQGETYGVTSACEGSVTPRQRKNQEIAWPRMESGGGSALDWFYHELRVQYAFQIKLRDTGSYGFLLPSENIIPTGREALSAVTYFGRFLLGDKAFEREEESVKPALETASGPWNDHLSRVAVGDISMDDSDAHSDGNTEQLMEDDVRPDTMGWELERRRRR